MVTRFGLAAETSNASHDQCLIVAHMEHTLSLYNFDTTQAGDICWWKQARRQNLVAGGTKKQKEGPKSRRGGHIFKIQYWIYAATGGPNVKWGGTDFKWGGGHHWASRWRRPWVEAVL